MLSGFFGDPIINLKNHFFVLLLVDMIKLLFQNVQVVTGSCLWDDMNEGDCEENSSWEGVCDSEVATGLQKAFYSLGEDPHYHSQWENYEHEANLQMSAS